MRPLHLVIAAGEGMLGPDRVLPFPPDSLKPLLVTTFGLERENKQTFHSHRNRLQSI